MQKSNKYAEKWQEHVAQFEASGLTSASEWCRRQQVCFRSFIAWRKRLKTTTSPESSVVKASSPFIELAEAAVKDSGVQIHFRSLRLVLDKHFDSNTLIKCLQLLEKI